MRPRCWESLKICADNSFLALPALVVPNFNPLSLSFSVTSTRNLTSTFSDICRLLALAPSPVHLLPYSRLPQVRRLAPRLLPSASDPIGRRADDDVLVSATEISGEGCGPWLDAQLHAANISWQLLPLHFSSAVLKGCLHPADLPLS